MVRKKSTRNPILSSSGDRTHIKYSTLGTSVTSTAAGIASTARLYAPANNVNLSNPTGPGIVNFYSTAKFLPGCVIRWEPSVSFTTTGRIFCSFSDNPEVVAGYFNLATITDQITYIKGMGSMWSFPVWQDRTIPFPTATRRKMFDVNQTVGLTDQNVLDRSLQTCFFYCCEGAPATTNLGSFWYHDVLEVEGIQPATT
jgi:hypothetical protein